MPKRTQTRLTKRIAETTSPGLCAHDSEVRGFGLRVTPAGARSFIFQYRTRAGEQGKVTIGAFPAMTVEDARRQARDLRSEVDRGGHPSRARRDQRAAPTIRQLGDDYCDVYAVQRGLKERTRRDARRLLENYAFPGIGLRKVNDVAPSDIRKVVSRAHEGSGRYEANRLRAVLSKMFSLAIQDDLRKDNPCKGVAKYHEDQRWRYLEDTQVRELLSACDRHPDQNAANAIRLLLFTGARLQEALSATWDQFDLDHGVWEKPSHHTKTKLRHRVRLADHTVTMLRQMRKIDPDGHHLFPGRKEGRPRSDLNKPWTAICADAGLEGFRKHDLRRTTASFMLSEGADLTTVGKTLGHTQTSTTARYAQLFEDVQQVGLNRAVARMTSIRTAA